MNYGPKNKLLIFNFKFLNKFQNIKLH